MNAKAASRPASGEWQAPTLMQSVIVELVLGASGGAIIVVSGRSFAAAYAAPVQPLLGLVVGLALGGALALATGYLVRRPAVAAGFGPFLARFTGSAPTPVNAALLGLAAAAGEETLFRAAIQPIAGIVIATLLFTAAHSMIGDLRHLTPTKAAYIAFALFVGVALGLLYERLGIAASMGFHAAFDCLFILSIRQFLTGAGSARVPAVGATAPAPSPASSAASPGSR